VETGKVEYAPDYKSQVELAMDEGRRIAESVIANNKFNAEHQRLKDAVVEAVKEERRLERLADEGKNTIVRTDALINSSRATRVRRQAVDALIEFEAEHKIGE
jgi:uncharacterized protein (DUF362 family)